MAGSGSRVPCIGNHAAAAAFLPPPVFLFTSLQSCPRFLRLFFFFPFIRQGYFGANNSTVSGDRSTKNKTHGHIFWLRFLARWKCTSRSPYSTDRNWVDWRHQRNENGKRSDEAKSSLPSSLSWKTFVANTEMQGGLDGRAILGSQRRGKWRHRLSINLFYSALSWWSKLSLNNGLSFSLVVVRWSLEAVAVVYLFVF